MKLSKHAKIRKQQRGIKDETIDLLFKYGQFIRQKGSTGVLVFPRKVKSSIEKKHLKIKNLKNAYIIITAKDKRVTKENSDVITVGHRYKKV
jgi:hypothetical protein